MFIFTPFISQVFLEAASNPLWIGAGYGFLKFHPQNNASLDKVGKDIIPIWQMSKARQREVKNLLKSYKEQVNDLALTHTYALPESDWIGVGGT